MDGRRIVQQAIDAQRVRDSHWMGPGLSVQQAMAAFNTVSIEGLSPGSVEGRELVRQALRAEAYGRATAERGGAVVQSRGGGRPGGRQAVAYTGREEAEDGPRLEDGDPFRLDVGRFASGRQPGVRPDSLGLVPFGEGPWLARESSDEDGCEASPRAGPHDCEGWQSEGFFCAERDNTWNAALSDAEVCLLQRAYEMINDHLFVIEEFFADHTSADGHCLLTRLTGGDFWFPSSMIYKTAVATSGPVSFWATNLFGSRYMLFDRSYLQAATDTLSISGEWDDCFVLQVASLIVHESCHSCFRWENLPYLLEHFFAHRVAQHRNWSGLPGCCANTPLESYDVTAYTFANRIWCDPAYDGSTVQDGVLTCGRNLCED